METLPVYVHLLFVATSLLTLWFLYKASSRSNLLLGVLMLWLLFQGYVANTGFYLITLSLPPRFLLLVLPPLLAIILLFSIKKGRAFIDGFSEKTLTYLHLVRVPVEIVLWLLCLNRLVPELMTFEGRNFDIFSGLSAPVIAYFGYSRHKLNKTFLIAWNCTCLVLLINIVTNAVLSAPFVFQQFAFEQPNVGVFYFPFAWLPGFVVPAVLFSHVVCLRKLMRKKG